VTVTTAPLVVDIRPVAPADLAYVRSSWAEGYKTAPGNAKLGWRIYKRVVPPELASVLERPETQVIGAFTADTIIGWLAYVPGRRVSTVHWVHTRYRVGEDGEPLRRRGIMTALLAHAQLTQRIVYTHRGGYPKHRHADAGHETSDAPIVRWLARNGVTAAYMPFGEWAL
jgi:hypothetical protein